MYLDRLPSLITQFGTLTTITAGSCENFYLAIATLQQAIKAKDSVSGSSTSPPPAAGGFSSAVFLDGNEQQEEQLHASGCGCLYRHLHHIYLGNSSIISS